MLSPRPAANCSEVIPSLKAEGSLRPDMRWKLRSPVPLLSTVDLEAPEKRLRKDGGTKLVRAGFWAMGWLMSV